MPSKRILLGVAVSVALSTGVVESQVFRPLTEGKISWVQKIDGDLYVASGVVVLKNGTQMLLSKPAELLAFTGNVGDPHAQDRPRSEHAIYEHSALGTSGLALLRAIGKPEFTPDKCETCYLRSTAGRSLIDGGNGTVHLLTRLPSTDLAYKSTIQTLLGKPAFGKRYVFAADQRRLQVFDPTTEKSVFADLEEFAGVTQPLTVIEDRCYVLSKSDDKPSVANLCSSTNGTSWNCTALKEYGSVKGVDGGNLEVSAVVSDGEGDFAVGTEGIFRLDGAKAERILDNIPPRELVCREDTTCSHWPSEVSLDPLSAVGSTGEILVLGQRYLVTVNTGTRRVTGLTMHAWRGADGRFSHEPTGILKTSEQVFVWGENWAQRLHQEVFIQVRPLDLFLGFGSWNFQSSDTTFSLSYSDQKQSPTFATFRVCVARRAAKDLESCRPEELDQGDRKAINNVGSTYVRAQDDFGSVTLRRIFSIPLLPAGGLLLVALVFLWWLIRGPVRGEPALPDDVIPLPGAVKWFMRRGVDSILRMRSRKRPGGHGGGKKRLPAIELVVEAASREALETALRELDQDEILHLPFTGYSDQKTQSVDLSFFEDARRGNPAVVLFPESVQLTRLEQPAFESLLDAAIGWRPPSPLSRDTIDGVGCFVLIIMSVSHFWALSLLLNGKGEMLRPLVVLAPEAFGEEVGTLLDGILVKRLEGVLQVAAPREAEVRS